MTILRLRNHIPIAGPARREAADGSETAMRVSLGFEPGWFTRRCAVDFSARWHTDPIYRHDTLVAMKAELHRAFPAVGYWNPANPDDTWTLSGVHGAYIIPQVFGCRLQYAADQWPVIVERPALSLDALADLDPDDLLRAPIVADLDRQMDIIAARHGKIHGYLNWQGVLNNAFNIRGQDIFLDLAMQPETTHRFLGLITETMIRVARHVQDRQTRSGFPVDHVSVSNCVVNMISPRHYRQFVLPYDTRIAESFPRFGVHTCNWNATPYLAALRELPRVGYIDMGIDTDLRRARDLFPDARRAVMLSPVWLHTADEADIAATMRRVYDELAPCDIVMADIQRDTPDARVQTLLDLCRRLEQDGARQTATTKEVTG